MKQNAPAPKAPQPASQPGASNTTAAVETITFGKIVASGSQNAAPSVFSANAPSAIANQPSSRGKQSKGGENSGSGKKIQLSEIRAARNSTTDESQPKSVNDQGDPKSDQKGIIPTGFKRIFRRSTE
jgi:hypothetical protein